MKKVFLRSLIAFVFAASSVWAAQSVPPEVISYPDTIVHNGKVYTMDDKSNTANAGSVVEALAIRDGKILLSGTNKQILSLRGPQTKVIDAKGRTVVPGIIDTHSHLFDYAMDSLGEASPRIRVKAQQNEDLARITFDQANSEWMEAVKAVAAYANRNRRGPYFIRRSRDGLAQRIDYGDGPTSNVNDEIRRLEAKFRRPASGRVSARAAVDPAEVARWASELSARGRVSAAVPVEVVDAAGMVYTYTAPIDSGGLGRLNRLKVAIGNRWFRFRRTKFRGFQAFVHDLDTVDRTIVDAGFRQVHKSRERITWQLAVFERA